MNARPVLLLLLTVSWLFSYSSATTKSLVIQQQMATKSSAVIGPHWFEIAHGHYKLVDGGMQAWLLDTSGYLVASIPYGISPYLSDVAKANPMVWNEDTLNHMLYLGKMTQLVQFDLMKRGIIASAQIPDLIGLWVVTEPALQKGVRAFSLDSMYQLDSSLQISKRTPMDIRKNISHADEDGVSVRPFQFQMKPPFMYFVFDTIQNRNNYVSINYCTVYSRLCAFPTEPTDQVIDSSLTIKGGEFNPLASASGKFLSPYTALDQIDGNNLEFALRSAFRYSVSTDDFKDESKFQHDKEWESTHHLDSNRLVLSKDLQLHCYLDTLGKWTPLSTNALSQDLQQYSPGKYLVKIFAKGEKIDEIIINNLQSLSVNTPKDSSSLLLRFDQEITNNKECAIPASAFTKYCTKTQYYARNPKWQRMHWLDSLHITQAEIIVPDQLLVSHIASDSFLVRSYSSIGKPLYNVAILNKAFGWTKAKNHVYNERIFFPLGDSLFVITSRGVIQKRLQMSNCDDLDYWPRSNIVIGLCDGIFTFVNLADSIEDRRLFGALLQTPNPFFSQSYTVEQYRQNFLIWDEKGHYISRSSENLPLAFVGKDEILPAERIAQRLFSPILWDAFLAKEGSIQSSPVIIPNLPSQGQSIVVDSVRLAQSFAPMKVDIHVSSKNIPFVPKQSHIIKVYAGGKMLTMQELTPAGFWLHNVQGYQTYSLKLYNQDNYLLDRLDTSFQLQDRYQAELIRLKQTPNKARMDTALNDFSSRIQLMQSKRIVHFGIGIDRYANSEWNLQYAVNDVEALSNLFSPSCNILSNLSFGDSIPQVCVTSNQTRYSMETIVLKSPLNGMIHKDSIPTKKNIQKILEQFSTELGPYYLQSSDELVITYSGHGFSDASGEFYLVPYDFPTSKADALTPSALASAISMKELAKWLMPIEANIALILDACQSGGSVQEGGLLSAPTAQLTLGQLAKEKQMMILSATQASDVALESATLKHGLLTSAMAAFAIGDSSADLDHDRSLSWKEWMLYPTKAVPELSAQITQQKELGRGFRRVNAESLTKQLTQKPIFIQFESNLMKSPTMPWLTYGWSDLSITKNSPIQ